MGAIKQSFLAKLVGLTLLGLVVVFIIDPLDQTTISTPFLLSIILMALSLRQTAPLVATVSVIYGIMTVYALIKGHHYFATHFYASPHPIFWLFQRAGLFFVVSVMAIYIASYRMDSERVHTRIQNILGKLPAPFVISDAAGYIVYVNEALSLPPKGDAVALLGKRYVDYFMTDIQEGKAMRYYIELFAAPGESVHELEIKPFNSENKVKARLTCIGSGSSRVMITLLADGAMGSRTGALNQVLEFAP